MAARRPPSRIQHNASTASHQPASLKPANSGHHHGPESNIQVVIRTRRRSDREKAENSPSIVSSDGPKSKEVTIQTSAGTSTLGVVSLPPAKTYPFDLVFGPEADQSLIYHDVVHPMLEQVLSGYNCTLFAYGQTGTGKTYTMQGDLAPTPLGNPSSHAGMIPRTLFRLFHSLETSGTDYSVKVSYVELYNEELRDLLAHETAPSSADGALKIFDDSKKGGVIIQGLEEVPVKDSKDALALLQKGSDRRQIAATKFNDHSSRSHSVFSLTVHIKESAAAGEDMLKIGKMNLVDLAGSENIGRSGAENKRAREAGMINQSLLTLGRVITSLVDKASHIPYRESKLTRLLQDSLGGRTRTCIIATISPARSNVEETLSTLDYALRAKSIKNKPELNARMTRNSLLKEYVAEIERLKADVLAAREKNGIFVSEDRWEQMNKEQEIRQTELDEAKRHVTMVEGQMRSLRDEYDQSIALLKQRDRDLADTKERLESAEEIVSQQQAEVLHLKRKLEEEAVVSRAHQATETALNGVALELKKVVHQSLRDIQGLFGKLDRQSSLLGWRTESVRSWHQTISASATHLTQSLERLTDGTAHMSAELGNKIRGFQASNVSALQAQTSQIDERLKELAVISRALKAKDADEATALQRVQIILTEASTATQALFSEWTANITSTCDKTCCEVEKLASANLSSSQEVLKNTSSLVDMLVAEVSSFTKSIQAAFLEAQTSVTTRSDKEIVRLQEQNERLRTLLEEEDERGGRMRDEIVQKVSGLLGDFVTEKDRRLREAIGQELAENEDSSTTSRELVHRHEQIIRGAEARSVAVKTGAIRRAGEAKRLREDAAKQLQSGHRVMATGLASLRTEIGQGVHGCSANLQRTLHAMQSSSTEALEAHSRIKRARVDTNNSVLTGVQTQYTALRGTLSSTSSNIATVSENVLSENSSWQEIVDAHRASSSQQLTALQRSSDAVLSDLRKDSPPTGSTPRKRKWKYTDQWALTKRRCDLLDDWRKDGKSTLDSETFLAEHSILPDDDEHEHRREMDVCEPPSVATEVVEEPLSLASTDKGDDGTDQLMVSNSSSGTSALPRPRHLRMNSAAKSRNIDVVALKDTQNVLTTRGSKRAR